MRDYQEEDRAILEMERQQRFEEELRAVTAERDALLKIILRAWDRDNDGVIRFKVNLARWDTAENWETGLEMVRLLAKLPSGAFKGCEGGGPKS